MIVSIKLRYIILTLYFITMCILFTLPGSSFPQSGWMGKMSFDKLIHIALFGLFTFLICWAMQISVKRGLLAAFLAAVIYGILIEVVQGQFIPNRSFDLVDWAADSIGGFAGVWFWNLRYIKK
jgi:VanZ family protein